MDPHVNFAYALVAVAPIPASSGTSLTITSGLGSLFPATSPIIAFNAVVWPVNTKASILNAEFVRVTTRSGDVFTILRAQESSNARVIVVGDQIALTVTAKTFKDIEDEIAAEAVTRASADTADRLSAIAMAVVL